MKSSAEASSIIGKKEYPAISILVPTHPPDTSRRIDREKLASLVTKAEEMIRKSWSKATSDRLIAKLHHAVNGINLKQLDKGLAVYVSGTIHKVIHLPFEVSEKVIVDESYEVRDLLYAAKLNTTLMSVVISQNRLITYYSFGHKFFRMDFPGMPDGTVDAMIENNFNHRDHSDANARDEKALHSYLRFIDNVLSRELKACPVPVVIFADRKLIGYFRKSTKNAKNIIGYVDGNFERSAPEELSASLQPVVRQWKAKELEKSLRVLDQAVNDNLYSAGITEVWRAAAEGRGRILFVERDYRIKARYGNDAYTILPDDQPGSVRNRIEDAVDDIIEMVLRNGGEVVFTDNGRLESYMHIALVNRY
ncbi:MAG: hypothetical protein IT242_06675 [Bacteroidia bacterium]|nr:hypothetical protein [Bacteroidia bacterium]